MADDEIRRYSLDELPEEMAARGDILTDWERLKREPGIELDDDFWRSARLVMPSGRGKGSIHLRVDEDVLDWFKGQGPGYQTRRNAVLRPYVESRRQGVKLTAFAGRTTELAGCRLAPSRKRCRHGEAKEQAH